MLGLARYEVFHAPSCPENLAVHRRLPGRISKVIELWKKFIPESFSSSDAWRMA